MNQREEEQMNSANAHMSEVSQGSYLQLTNKYLNSMKGYQKQDILTGKVNRQNFNLKSGESAYKEIAKKCANSVRIKDNTDTLVKKINLSSVKFVSDKQSILDASGILEQKIQCRAVQK